MKVIKYRQITPKKFDSKEVKSITGRVVIGKNEGADNFCMRLFEVEPGGYTPKHIHRMDHGNR
jgi:quercetin dioxygenase-like cupin family protein